MNTYFFVAGILCVLLGIIHSALGEFLIFRHKRYNGSIVPSKASKDLRERYLRIIWATWHLASIFGWCMGAILIKISMERSGLSPDFEEFLIHSMSFTMLLSSLLVMFGTKGKHPGWMVLLVITVLLWLGN